MSKTTTVSNGQFLFGKYIVIIACVAVSVAMGRLIWWSFLQTWDWFRYMDAVPEVAYVSLCFAVIFQFGQNICTFFFGKYRARTNEMQRRLDGYKNIPDPSLGDAYIRYMSIKDERNFAKAGMLFWGFGFVVTAFVDAWTNVAQMNAAQGVNLVSQDKRILNYVFGTTLVFFEEGLGVVMSALGHTINDALEIQGYSRLAWLDLFSQGATDILSGGMGRPAEAGSLGSTGTSSNRLIGRSSYRRQVP